MKYGPYLLPDRQGSLSSQLYTHSTWTATISLVICGSYSLSHTELHCPLYSCIGQLGISIVSSHIFFLKERVRGRPGNKGYLCLLSAVSGRKWPVPSPVFQIWFLATFPDRCIVKLDRTNKEPLYPL